MGRYVYVKERKTLPYEKGHWSEKKHIEAITTYLATGNITETARLINVPVVTVRSWMQKDWWESTIKEIQNGEGQKQDNKMTKVIDRALEVLITRIEEGDYQYDQKTGRMVKVPLKARDLERVASGLFDKRQLIRKAPTNIKESDLNQAERLVKLAQQFAEMAGKKPVEKLVNEHIEGEFEEVYDINPDQKGMQQ